MNASASAPGHDERRQRIAVLMVCCLSLLMVGVDITAVNVALPAIGAQFDAGVSGLQWTVDAYTVVLASLLMLGGSLGDRWGRRRVFVTGLIVFSAASLLCAAAQTVEMLIAFRALQAVGASMLNPVAMSIIANTFTDPRERAQAVGVWGAMFGVSMALGPIVGGALVSASGWPAIFLLNLPLGIAAIVLTLRVIPESRAPHPRRFDPVGQLLIVTLLATLTFGIIEAPVRGWSSPLIALVLGAAVLAVVGLLAHEPRRREPLLDLRFFRSAPFSASIVVAVVAFGGFLFVNTLYLQDVRGLSPVQAGLAVLPMAVMTAAMSPISGRLVARRGPRAPLVGAGAAMLVAPVLLFGVSASTSLLQLAAAYVIFGIGFGLVNAPVTNAAVSGMPRAQAGVAAAVATTSRQVGMTLGVAIVGAVVTSRLDGSVAAGLGAASTPAWWLIAAWGGAVVVLGLVATSARAAASARRTAARLNPEALAA